MAKASRSESLLLEIINSSENSNKCGECGSCYPTWASWNLGVLLCGRCASLHRVLGFDVSRVKSLSLEEWNEKELQQLKVLGNKKNTKKWNPRRIPFPFDEDDKTGMEAWIKDKYIKGKFLNESYEELDYNLGYPRSSTKSASKSPSFESDDFSRIGNRSYTKLSSSKTESRHNSEVPPPLPRRRENSLTANKITTINSETDWLSRPSSSPAPTHHQQSTFQPMIISEVPDQTLMQPQIYQYVDPIDGLLKYVDQNGQQYVDSAQYQSFYQS
ncbi:hypothetical protein LJB42_004144 [Komagataella kurtzmanii]|nr:hypothetical protein LJB42_004144 [Komagataella kurtzmanii]